jgi:LuxR family maltose regulon positive regulatory protein
LFIVPLDNQRQWYRYHPLFMELLRHQLNKTYPERVSDLHARASQWYEQQDRLEEAIQHGLQAQRYDPTARLIEMAFQRRNWIRHDMHHLLTWFEALPTPVTSARPRLILAYAWLLLEIFADRWEQIEGQLRQVESILIHPALSTGYSDEDRSLMLAQVDLLRANQARQAGATDRVIALCQQVFACLPENEMYIRGGTLAHLASAYESSGNTAAALKLFIESVQMCRAAHNIDGLLFASSHLIEVHSLSGQLRRAERVFEQAAEYTDGRTGPDMGMVYIGIGEVYREQNKLEMAKDFLQRGVASCRPFEAWRTSVVMGEIGVARVVAAGGQLDEAGNMLLDIEKQYPHVSLFEAARLESVQTRLYLRQGNFSAAARWAQRSGLSDMADADYMHEFDRLTFIRVLLAQAALEAQGLRALRLAADPIQAADRHLQNLYQAALAGGRMSRILEIHILHALLHTINQETTHAVQRLEAALVLAEPEGYVRLFVDEGLPMYQLLMMLRTRPISSSISVDYLNTLRDAFPRSFHQTPAESALIGSTLTASEYNALRLLASERSIEEIAAELSVEVSTVRTYAKRIYSKLDAHSRAEAVYRARELKLL